MKYFSSNHTCCSSSFTVAGQRTWFYTQPKSLGLCHYLMLTGWFFFSSSVYFLFIYSSDGIHDTFVIAFLELFLLRKQGLWECIFKGDRAIFWFFSSSLCDWSEKLPCDTLSTNKMQLSLLHLHFSVLQRVLECFIVSS